MKNLFIALVFLSLTSSAFAHPLLESCVSRSGVKVEIYKDEWRFRRNLTAVFQGRMIPVNLWENRRAGHMIYYRGNGFDLRIDRSTRDRMAHLSMESPKIDNLELICRR